ncbi:hypothetical protein IQ07DRAFT_525677, partial [Pyrenochaeta sp. DS3sAY3a]
LEGHSDWVNSVAFSPDPARLTSASGDRTVKIWDASSGACLQTLEGYGDGVYSANDISRLASFHLDEVVGQGAAMSSDGIWISNNSQNVLWLPTEYRPSCSDK